MPDRPRAMPGPKRGKDATIGQRKDDADNADAAAALDLELLALAEQFAAEWRAERKPQLSDYLRRYPQHAARLTDFVAGLLAEEPEEEGAAGSAALPLAPGTLRALDSIFAQDAENDQAKLARVAERPAGYTAGTGLLGVARAAGLGMNALATETDLSPEVLTLLDERSLAGARVPAALVARLSAALGLAPTRVVALMQRAGADALSAEGVHALLTTHPSLSKEQRARWERLLNE